MRFAAFAAAMLLALPAVAAQKWPTGASFTTMRERAPYAGLAVRQFSGHTHGENVASQYAEAPDIDGGACRYRCADNVDGSVANFDPADVACDPSVAECLDDVGGPNGAGDPYSSCTGIGTQRLDYLNGSAAECVNPGFSECAEVPDTPSDVLGYCIGHGGFREYTTQAAFARDNEATDVFIRTDHIDSVDFGVSRDVDQVAAVGAWFKGAHGRGVAGVGFGDASGENADGGDEWAYPAGYTPTDPDDEMEWQAAWADEYNDPGTFVTLMGKEYSNAQTGTNTFDGNHVVIIYPGTDFADCTGASGCFDDQTDLAALMQHSLDEGACFVMAHPALPPELHFDIAEQAPLMPAGFQFCGYEVGGTPPKVYEGSGTDGNGDINSPQQFNSLEDMLGRGLKFGIWGGNDVHGLRSSSTSFTGVWDASLTRDSIFEEMQARHTFAAVNLFSSWIDPDSMTMWFTIGAAMMGDVLPVSSKPTRLHMRATNTAWAVDDSTGLCFVVGGGGGLSAIAPSPDCVTANASSIERHFRTWAIYRDGTVWRSGSCESATLCEYAEMIDASQAHRYRAVVNFSATNDIEGRALMASPIWVE